MIELLENRDLGAGDFRGRGIGAHQPHRACDAGADERARANDAESRCRRRPRRATAAGEHKPRVDDHTSPRPWSHLLLASAPAPSSSWNRHGSQGGPDSLHHRSDEDDESDRSEKAGRVTAILAKNGEPVEFGQPLFSSNNSR